MQTFGEDYQINKPDVDIEIRLKRPGDQLSVYDKTVNQQKPSSTTAPADPKPH